MTEQLKVKGLTGPEALSQQPEQAPTSNEVTGLVAPEQPAPQFNGLIAAREQVADVHGEQELKDVLASLDLDEKNINLLMSGSYRADAEVYSHDASSSRMLGKGQHSKIEYFDRNDNPHTNKWGSPYDKAHLESRPVEQVGIRESKKSTWTNEEISVRRPGWRGKLGLKTTITRPKVVDEQPIYTFDYEFAAPSVRGDEAAKAAGNNTGQHIRLSLEVSKEQAETLSAILAKDPTAARSVLDTVVAAKADNGAWNAELFDETGKFYDPGKRYDRQLLARDVRPNYAAIPDLKPEVISLLPTAESERKAA